MQAKQTLWLGTGEGEGQRLWTLDQTLLPFQCVEIELASLEACIHAIRTMQVRGAPLIGSVAAFGFAYGARHAASFAELNGVYDALLRSRPTAVNLRGKYAKSPRSTELRR